MFTLFSQKKIMESVEHCSGVYHDDSQLASQLNTLLGIDAVPEASFEKERCHFLANAQGLQLYLKKDDSELGAANKSISLGGINFIPETYFTDLSGWNQPRFLALHVYFLVRQYHRIKNKAGDYMAIENKNIPKKELLDTLLEELFVAVNAQRLVSTVMKQVNFVNNDEAVSKDVVNAFYDSLVSTFEAAGEKRLEICFPCGTPLHAVYLYFTKINQEQVVLRIDNVGAGARENHVEDEKREIKKTVNIKEDPKEVSCFEFRPHIISITTVGDMAKSAVKKQLTTYLHRLCYLQRGFKNKNDTDTNKRESNKRLAVLYNKINDEACKIDFPYININLKNDWSFQMMQKSENCVYSNYMIGVRYRFYDPRGLLPEELFDWLSEKAIKQKITKERNCGFFAAFSTRRQSKAYVYTGNDSITHSKIRSWLLKHYKTNTIIKPLYQRNTLGVNDLFIPLALSMADETENRFDPLAKQSFKSNELIKWPYLFVWSKQEMEVQKEKESLQLAPVNKVLVNGHAGSGKTTLSRRIAWEWCMQQEKPGKSPQALFDRFDWVFWIPLRQLAHVYTNKQQNAGSVVRYSLGDIVYALCCPAETLLASDGKPIEKCIIIQAINNLISANTPRILWLLDGYDEISLQQFPPSIKALLQSLLTEPEYALLLTTRPINSIHPLPANTRVIETRGFTAKEVDKYIDNFFKKLQDKNGKLSPQPDLAIDLSIFLRKHPRLRQISYTPINTELICSMWTDRKVAIEKNATDQKLASLTGLYRMVVEFLLRHYLQFQEERYLNRGSRPWLLFDEIEDPLQYDDETWTTSMVNKACRSILDFLQCLAFLGLKQFGEKGELIVKPALINEVQKQMVLTDTQTIHIMMGIRRIGLLRPVTTTAHNLLENEYEFMHLSFQEYLAGMYVATHFCQEKPLYSLENKTPISFSTWFACRKYHPSYKLLWEFTVGNLALDKRTEKLTQLFIQLLTPPIDELGWDEIYTLMRWSDEGLAGFPDIQRQSVANYLGEIWKWVITEFSDYSQCWKNFHSRLADCSCLFQHDAFLAPARDLFFSDDIEVKMAAHKALNKQTSLPESMLVQLADVGLPSSDDQVRRSTIKILITQSSLPKGILTRLADIGLFDEDYYIRECISDTSIFQAPQLKGALTELAVKTLLDNDDVKRKSAIKALKRLSVLSNNILTQLANVGLSDKDVGIRSSTIEVFRNQTSLPNNILAQLANVGLSDKDVGIRSSTVEVFRNQTSLLNNILVQLASVGLSDKDVGIRSSTIEVFRNQTSLPNNILAQLANVGLPDKIVDIRRLTVETLKKQTSLPKNILTQLVRVGLFDKDDRTANFTAEALGNQSSLPNDIIIQLAEMVLFNKNLRAWIRSTLSFQVPQLKDALTKLAVKTLLDNDDVRRESAVETLNRLSPLPNDILTQLADVGLFDKNIDIRRLTVGTLRRQTSLPENILTQLVAVGLFDKDNQVVSSTAEALGNQSSLPNDILARLANIGLFNKNDYVRVCIRNASKLQASQLKSALTELAVKTLLDNDDVRRESAVETLKRLSPLSNGILVKLADIGLPNENVGIRKSTVETLENQISLPNDILAQLADIVLSDKDVSLRRSIVKILKNKTSLPEHITVQLAKIGLFDKNVGVRRSTVEILGNQISLPERILIKLTEVIFYDENRDIRGAAARVLGLKSPLPKNVRIMLEKMVFLQTTLFDTFYFDSSIYAAEALIQAISLPRCIIAGLAQIPPSSDEDDFVRKVALEYVGTPPLSLTNNDRISMAMAFGQICHLPESTQTKLAKMLLSDGNDEVRKYTAAALGQLPSLPEGILCVLVDTVLQDKNICVKRYAASALVLGRPYLLSEDLQGKLAQAALHDKDDYIKSSLIKALGQQPSLMPEIVVSALAQMADLSMSYYLHINIESHASRRYATIVLRYLEPVTIWKALVKYAVNTVVSMAYQRWATLSIFNNKLICIENKNTFSIHLTDKQKNNLTSLFQKRRNKQRWCSRELLINNLKLAENFKQADSEFQPIVNSNFLITDSDTVTNSSSSGQCSSSDQFFPKLEVFPISDNDSQRSKQKTDNSINNGKENQSDESNEKIAELTASVYSKFITVKPRKSRHNILQKKKFKYKIKISGLEYLSQEQNQELHEKIMSYQQQGKKILRSNTKNFGNVIKILVETKSKALEMRQELRTIVTSTCVESSIHSPNQDLTSLNN